MSASPATVPARRVPAPARRRAAPAKKAAGRPKREPAKRPVWLVRSARRRRKAAPFVVLSGLLIGALVVGIVTLQAMVSQTAFRMQDLQTRAKALQQEYGEQTLAVARLSSPERIAAAAQRAGLVLPDPSQIHTLHVRAVTTARGHAGQAANASASGSGAPAAASLKAVLGAEP